ncbi:HEAT repeat domain-containing protein [Bdellovibrionota bacterium FG-1]
MTNIGVFGALGFLGTAAAFAMPIPTTPSAPMLTREITTRSAPSFEPLLRHWQTNYGTLAVAPLLEVASQNIQDSHRYIALMGAAKLGGPAAASLFVPFLKDSSWMIRAGTLRILSALNQPTTAPAILPLLKDPALVVRAEAVEAAKKLHPPGTAEALADILEQPANYHNGKAQWIPQKALAVLASLQATTIISRLKPLLEHSQDPDLLTQTVTTLEKLTGITPKKGASLSARVQKLKK